MGMPIAMMLAATTGIALYAHTYTSLLVLPQQLFNALDNSILLSIPFFIVAGGIMTEGSMARRLIAVINAFVGPYPGGLAVATTIGCLFFAALYGLSGMVYFGYDQSDITIQSRYYEKNIATLG